MRFKKMMDYFEDYYRDSLEMNSLMKTEAAQLNQAVFGTQDVFAQVNLQTATWMIPVYEQIFALDTDPDDSLELRRKRLMAYQRLRSPTTRKEFKNYLLEFADIVEIYEIFQEYKVKFIFSGEHINLKEINRVLNRTMPAHLSRIVDLERETSLNIYVTVSNVISGTVTILQRMPALNNQSILRTGIAISHAGTSSILTSQISPRAAPVLIGGISSIEKGWKDAACVFPPLFCYLKGKLR